MVHNCKERSPSPFYRIGEQPSNIGYSTHSKIQDYEPTSQAYVVVSHPINHVHDIFSRAARVCLATSEADFDSGNITNGSLRTKLSWQSTTRRPEIEFYQEAITRSPIEQLAKIIAGGYFISTLQKDGRLIQVEQTVDEGNTEYIEPRHALEEYCNAVRELRWILFEDGGKLLRVFVDIMEPVQAICDALEAYHTLAEKRTLYRDISDSNVLVDGRRWKWTSHRP